MIVNTSDLQTFVLNINTVIQKLTWTMLVVKCICNIYCSSVAEMIERAAGGMSCWMKYKRMRNKICVEEGVWIPRWSLYVDDGGGLLEGWDGRLARPAASPAEHRAAASLGLLGRRVVSPPGGGSEGRTLPRTTPSWLTAPRQADRQSKTVPQANAFLLHTVTTCKYS